MFKLKLKGKIVFPAVCIAVALVIALTAFSAVQFTSYTYTLLDEIISTNANILRSVIYETGNDTYLAARSAAADPDVIRAIQARDTAELVRILTARARYDRVGFYTVLDYEGVVWARTHEPARYGDTMTQSYIWEAIGGRTVLSKEAGNTIRVSVRTTTPILDDNGTVVGVMSVGVRFDNEPMMDELKSRYNAEFTVFSGEEAVATSLHDGGRRAEDITLSPDLARRLFEEGREYFGTTDFFGDRHTSFYLPLLNIDNEPFAAIAVSVSQAGVIRGLNQLLIGLIGIGIASIAVSAIIMLRLGGRIAKPLLASADSLRTVSESLESAVSQVNDSAASIAESSNEQAASVEETSATINQTSAMIANNAENTRTAAELAEKSAAAGEETGKFMAELIGTMGELKESSATVSKIVKTIDDIAFQTNLLAINATVEAARAGGDSGRSFGVVAEEVRNLAQRSAQSAADTAEIINRNLALSNASASVAEKVLQLSNDDAEATLKLGKLIAEINAASAEQASGAEQINAAMGQIEKSTQSNAATSQQSAASAAMLRELVGDLDMIYRNVNAVVSGGDR